MKKLTTNPLADLSPAELQQIANRIVYLRQNILRMTQHQFADAVEISQPYLSLLENQKKEFNMETLMQIASFLNINLDWLIYGIGGDKNIFRQGYHEQRRQADALVSLKKAYSLKSTDIEFIQKYLSLSDKERSAIIKASDALRKLL